MKRTVYSIPNLSSSERDGVDRSQKNKERALNRPVEHARHEPGPVESAPINSPRFIYLSNGPVVPRHLITTIYASLGLGPDEKGGWLSFVGADKSAPIRERSADQQLRSVSAETGRSRGRSFLTSSRVRGGAFCFTPRYGRVLEPICRYNAVATTTAAAVVYTGRGKDASTRS